MPWPLLRDFATLRNPLFLPPLRFAGEVVFGAPGMTSRTPPSRSLIRRPEPLNLCEEDRWLFANAAEMTLPSRELTTLSDVEVFGRGPLRQAGEYLPTSFVSPEHLVEWKRRRNHWRSAAERLVQRAKPFDSPALWITDNWSCGYYHWFGDALPRLEAFLDELPLSELTLLLPYKFGRAAYFRDSLQPFGLKEVRVLNRFERLRCRELFMPSHVAPTGNFDELVMRSMRHRFVSACAHPADAPSADVQSTDSPERIYISRRLAPSRRVANEDELTPVLEKHGVVTITAEKLSWREQVQLIGAAKVLVSSHGAGLTNMLGMKSGTQVMEIRAERDDKNNCYFTLAAAMQMHYYYLLAAREQPDAVVHATDLVVDPEQLDEALSAMLPPSLAAEEPETQLSVSDRLVA